MASIFFPTKNISKYLQTGIVGLTFVVMGLFIKVSQTPDLCPGDIHGNDILK
jgi:hypothetical protein